MATEYRSADDSAGSTEPRNSSNLDDIVGEVAPEPAGKQRKPRSDAGKPRGPRTGAKAKASTSSLDLSGLAGVIVGLTDAIAAWREVPELGLSQGEADELARASQNVLRHYNIETTQKGADFMALTGVVTMIVGTRIAAYKLRTKMEAEERRSAPMAPNVVRMQSASSAPAPKPAAPVAPSPPSQTRSAAAPVMPMFMDNPPDPTGDGF